MMLKRKSKDETLEPVQVTLDAFSHGTPMVSYLFHEEKGLMGAIKMWRKRWIRLSCETGAMGQGRLFVFQDNKEKKLVTTYDLSMCSADGVTVVNDNNFHFRVNVPGHKVEKLGGKSEYEGSQVVDLMASDSHTMETWTEAIIMTITRLANTRETAKDGETQGAPSEADDQPPPRPPPLKRLSLPGNNTKSDEDTKVDESAPSHTRSKSDYPRLQATVSRDGEDSATATGATPHESKVDEHSPKDTPTAAEGTASATALESGEHPDATPNESEPAGVAAGEGIVEPAAAGAESDTAGGDTGKPTLQVMGPLTEPLAPPIQPPTFGAAKKNGRSTRRSPPPKPPVSAAAETVANEQKDVQPNDTADVPVGSPHEVPTAEAENNAAGPPSNQPGASADAHRGGGDEGKLDGREGENMAVPIATVAATTCVTVPTATTAAIGAAEGGRESPTASPEGSAEVAPASRPLELGDQPRQFAPGRRRPAPHPPGGGQHEDTANSGQAVPEKSPDDGAKAPEKSPDDGANVPEKAPDDGANAPEKAPDDSANAPEKAPDDGANVPEKAPDDGANAPEKAPDDGANVPEKAPDRGTTTLQEPPSPPGNGELGTELSPVAMPGAELVADAVTAVKDTVAAVKDSLVAVVSAVAPIGFGESKDGPPTESGKEEGAPEVNEGEVARPTAKDEFGAKTDTVAAATAADSTSGIAATEEQKAT